MSEGANNVKQVNMMRERITCAEFGKLYHGRTLTHAGKKYSYYVHTPDRDDCTNKVSLKRDEYDRQARLRLIALHIFDRDRWLDVIGEHDDQRQNILAEMAECERDLESLAEQSENNRIHLRKNVMTAEAYTKNEDEIDAERTILNNRMAQLSVTLNSPMYRELAIDPSEIEAEYA